MVLPRKHTLDTFNKDVVWVVDLIEKQVDDKLSNKDLEIYDDAIKIRISLGDTDFDLNNWRPFVKEQLQSRYQSAGWHSLELTYNLISWYVVLFFKDPE